MNRAADPRLIRLLGGDPLAALRLRLRRHFERAEANGAFVTFRLSKLDPLERAALASLMRRPPSHATSMTIDVAEIDRALRDAGIADSLRQALEHLDGPIVNRRQARAQAQAHWSAVAAAVRHPGLASLLQTPAGLALLKRLARTDQERARMLCEKADAVLTRLPAQGLPRAQLAAEALGDAHGLDGGRPTATLVLAAWRQVDEPAPAADGAEPDQTESPRETWARAGILVNELAKPALFLNLPTDGRPVLAEAGEPAYASLRLLLRSPPAWAVAGRTVFVCENPNLLAIAADHLGSRCAPLVCTDGMPAAAQKTLLRQLTAAGADLLYHGDFDWSGLRIANHMIQVHGARPWRFHAAEYQAAARLVQMLDHKLAGTPVAAAWDPALAIVMEEHGVAIAEESLATSLLEDLSAGRWNR